MSAEPAGLDAQSLRDMRENAESALEQVRAHGDVYGRAADLARHVVALTDEVSRLVGCVAEAERRAEQDEADDAIHIAAPWEPRKSLCGQWNRRNLAPFEEPPSGGEQRCWSCLDAGKWLADISQISERDSLRAALADARDALEQLAKEPMTGWEVSRLAREVLGRLDQESGR